MEGGSGEGQQKRRKGERGREGERKGWKEGECGRAWGRGIGKKERGKRGREGERKESLGRGNMKEENGRERKGEKEGGREGREHNDLSLGGKTGWLAVAVSVSYGHKLSSSIHYSPQLVLVSHLSQAPISHQLLYTFPNPPLAH